MCDKLAQDCAQVVDEIRVLQDLTPPFAEDNHLTVLRLCRFGRYSARPKTEERQIWRVVSRMLSLAANTMQ
jgi:hypothetical protein